jgi:CO/xanthine dehydrogenase FAD-binding subunit
VPLRRRRFVAPAGEAITIMPWTSFEYHRPDSLDALLELLERTPDAALLAGGTDLLVDLRRGAKRVDRVISLRDVHELRGIREEGDAVAIGATTPLAEVAEDPAVARWLPDVAEAVRSIGGPQVRSTATLGGNLCTAASCADSAVPLLARGARVVLRSRRGERELPLEDFFTGPRRTALGPGEVLASVHVPKGAEGTTSGAFFKFGLREGSAISVASVAACVEVADGRIRRGRVALGAVAPTPMIACRASELLENAPIAEETLRKVAEKAAREARPIDDLRGSAEYRRELVRVLTRRALVKALERAGIEVP